MLLIFAGLLLLLIALLLIMGMILENIEAGLFVSLLAFVASLVGMAFGLIGIAQKLCSR
jgi:hypothetical protein